LRSIVKVTLALSILFCGLALAQEEKPRAAVYIMGNPEGRDFLRSSVNSFLIRSGKYLMIAVDALDAVAQEHQRQMSGAVSDADVARMGLDAGAQYVCVVERTELDGISYVATRMVNVETKVADLASEIEELPRGRNIIDVVKRQINVMLDTTSPPPQKPAEPAPEPASAPPEPEPAPPALAQEPATPPSVSEPAPPAPKPAQAEPATPAQPAPSPGNRMKIGGGAALAIQTVNTGASDSTIGVGFQFNLMLSTRVTKNFFIDYGIGYQYRIFDAANANAKFSFEESAVSFPITARLTAARVLYFEGGLNIDIPSGTKATGYYDSDGKKQPAFDEPRPISDRSAVDFGLALGTGLAFNIDAVTFLLGYKLVLNFTEMFDSVESAFNQHSVIFAVLVPL
jgi:hypothetical protein